MNNVWEIPEPLSTCEVQLDDDTVTILRRHGNPAGPRLVLSHGNGLAIDLYYPFWSLLAEDFDLVIFDFRNHGWNTVGPRANHNVPTLVRDHLCIFEAIDRHYGNKPKIGIFHSASALITLLSLTTMADLLPSAQSSHLSAMILFDPPLCKPGNSQIEFDEAAEYAAEVTRRRGYLFQTEEDFAELLSFLPGFSRVVPGVRELMAKTTLRKAADGQGYELRCPRDYEAQIVDYMRSFSALMDFETLPCPTKVIGSDPTLPYTFLPTIDLGDILTVDYDFVPETTHFLQLEKPEECVELVREFIESNHLQ